eukprot:UN00336
MLAGEYQMMIDNITIPTTPQGCDEYKRYRTVHCIVIDQKTSTTTIVDDNECITYYKELEIKQNDIIAKNTTYIPVPILTTKPLQEESCFMYYPPCAAQDGPWIGTNLTNTDHIHGDDADDNDENNNSVGYYYVSALYVLVLTSFLALMF